MKSFKTKDAAEQIGISYPTIKQWIYEGKIKSIKTPGGHHRIPEEEIRRITGEKELEQNGNSSKSSEPISVRNRLVGEVLEVRYEGLFAEVKMNVGGQIIISIITRSGCEELGLRKGMRAAALFKATEVMISLA
ncbi:MAG: helix-turn-helix transcriptional regulator [Pyrinomonadaceae bacterium]|nr:helix-turn-helix transcriptional regulator [Pyrinomonadaceae bacterium]